MTKTIKMQRRGGGRRLLFLTAWGLATLLGPGEGQVRADAEDPSKGYKARSPAELWKQIEKSPIAYDVTATDGEKVITDLGWPKATSQPLDPYTVVKRKGRHRTVVVKPPTGKVAKLFKLGLDQLHKKDHRAALATYKKALAAAPGFYKAWTYVGNTYFILKQYKKARKHLERAVKLNPIGYQERIFLADTYLALGLRQKALQEAARMLMLNKNSSTVRNVVRRILKANDLVLDMGRFRLAFILTKMGPNNIEIRVADATDLAMALCLATWTMEPLQRKIVEYYKQKKRVNTLRDRECLGVYFFSLRQFKRDKQVMSHRHKQVLGALGKGQAEAMLYWELLASRYPQAVLGISRKDRKKIVEYILTYVFKKRSAPGPGSRGLVTPLR